MRTGKVKENVILLAASFGVSLIWIVLGRDQYRYNYSSFEVRGFDWFPFLLWGLGLYLIYSVYLVFSRRLKEDDFFRRFFIFLLLYWPTLIVAETVGYHYFGIHDLATSAYPGLPVCDCMHSPFWMQAVYFSLGPIYFFICHLLRLKYKPRNYA